MSDAIKRIRRTWAKAAADPVVMTQYFYTRLFQIIPEAEPLFRADMDAQGVKLAETLGFVVDHIDDPDALLPAARDLAVRHVSYGVAADQYGAVGQALLDTFHHALGADFSQQDHDAWADAYGTLTDYMIAQAY